jgi:uncharacterized repeat protein (TIGR01451 family)
MAMKCVLSIIALALFSPAVRADPAELLRDALDANVALPASMLQPNPVARAQVLAAIPAGGVLLVTDSTNNRVLALDPLTGTIIDANFIPASSQLSTPVNAVLSPNGQEVWVSDQINDVVQRFSVATGSFIATLAPQGGLNNALLDNIRGIELSPENDLLVTVGAGGNIHAIARFDTAGANLPAFVASGAVASIFSPFDIYRLKRSGGALQAGRYLVSSSDTGKLTQFSATGALVAEFTTAGTFPQQITEAQNGNILVGSFGVNTDGVYEFTNTGAQVARLDDPTIGGYRGVFELANGNVLTTTGSGIYELNRTTGVIVSVKINGIQARFIEFAQGPGAGPGVDLSLEKTASAAALNLGDDVRFTLIARNLSTTLPANTVQVNDNLPPGLVYLSNTCAASVVGNTLNWAIGTLAAGASQSCSILTRASQSGTALNRASVSAAGTDPQPANNVAEAAVSIGRAPIPASGRWALALLAGLLTLVATLWLSVRRD